MSEEQQAFAKELLENLISFFGLNVEVEVTNDGDYTVLHVPSSELNGFLIGQGGDTLRSLQLLVSMAFSAKFPDAGRVTVDVADYKKQRQERLAAQAKQWAEAVAASGVPMELAPMNAADRRIIHQQASETEGVVSESSGEARNRHVIIRKDA